MCCATPQGTKLVLDEQPEAGVCGSECKTIAKAALEIVGDHDTDIAEMLWKVGGPPLNVIHNSRTRNCITTTQCCLRQTRGRSTTKRSHSATPTLMS